MNIDDISTQLMYTTAPVVASLPDNKISTGTGFIFSVKQSDQMSIPLLITNYHVVENAVLGFVELHVARDGRPTKDVIQAQFGSETVKEGKLGELDLVAFPIAGAINDMQSKGIQVYFKSIDESIIPKDNVIDEFAAIESVTFIGYPNSIYDIENKIPVIRQGITATPIWNNFQGREEFLIDAGVFPGSSGSPVLVYNQGSFPTKDGISIGNRILFVGVLTRTLRTTADDAYLDLGKVINCRAFYRELEKYINKMTGRMID